MGIVVNKKAIEEASKKLSNWGRWGKDDHIGTLNHVTPEDIVKAASLIRTGKVFALGIPLDRTGPQTGLFGGRFNPIHQMLATGTDAIAGQQDWNKLRYADDTLTLCVQGATHWDALGHIFYEDKAYRRFQQWCCPPQLTPEFLRPQEIDVRRILTCHYQVAGSLSGMTSTTISHRSFPHNLRSACALWCRKKMMASSD